MAYDTPAGDMQEQAAMRPDPLSDDDLLAMVRAERAASVGLDNNSELLENTEKALEYSKGQMDDLPSLENRSSAVTTDIADAIETVLPDLMEVFFGGEDVITFSPRGKEDEAAAQQETDYVTYVALQQNPGFLNLYTWFKDALQAKRGVIKFWPEDCHDAEELPLQGKTELEIFLAKRDGWEVESLGLSKTQAALPQPLMGSTAMTPPPAPLFDAVLVRRTYDRRIKISPVAPEHFAVSKDTVDLAETPYCCMRSHPRAHELLVDGYDPADVDRLPEWTQSSGQGGAAEQSRDTAGESAQAVGPEIKARRQVEIVEHFIRVLDEETNDLVIWRVVTGADETILLEREKATLVPFAALTPYIQTHRFYGESLADKLMEIQRIRTALLRIALDSAYFALNQRFEVADSELTETTLEDLVDNQPNRPVVTKTGNGIKPLTSPGPGFDPFTALEFMSTQAEQRSGVVRNAQGLNPDTLHDTATGAMQLMNMANKRVRMIARVFAETGVKQLYLGVHQLLREGPAQPQVVRLRNEWIEVDPTPWGVRQDMDVHVGVGSGGREYEVAAMRGVLGLQKELKAAGYPITGQNVYAAAKRLVERSGVKGAEQYIPPPPDGPPPPPPPDPKLMEVQQKAALEEKKVLLQVETERRKIELQHELDMEQMRQEIALKQQQIEADARVRAVTSIAGAPVHPQPPQVHMGGQPG